MHKKTYLRNVIFIMTLLFSISLSAQTGSEVIKNWTALEEADQDHLDVVQFTDVKSKDMMAIPIKLYNNASFSNLNGTATISNSLSSQDQESETVWECFKIIKEVQEFKNHYPTISDGSEPTHIVFNNGFDFPSTNGDAGIALLDKGDVFGGSHANFFVFQKAEISDTEAHIELIYYYNFEGDFRHYQSGKFDLVKSEEGWAISNSELNQSNN